MTEQADMVRDLRSVLGGIDAGVLEAQQAAALQEQEALEYAAELERQAALEQSLVDALAGSEAVYDPMTVDPNMFITQETADLAGVSPYNYDLYDPNMALAMALGYRDPNIMF